jgi:hypothetical protein
MASDAIDILELTSSTFTNILRPLWAMLSLLKSLNS